MIDLYYWTTPNGHKITLFLEEAGLEYGIKPVNIGKGEQFDPGFLKIAPNNRIPAMVDHSPPDGGAPLLRLRRRQDRGDLIGQPLADRQRRGGGRQQPEPGAGHAFTCTR